MREHVKKLFDSTKVYRMEIPLTYHAYFELGVTPTRCSVDVAIAVWSWGAYLGEKVLNNGYEEGIVLDYLENVSEGSGENLFVVLNGKLITPNLASSVISEKTQLSNLQIRV